MDRLSFPSPHGSFLVDEEVLSVEVCRDNAGETVLEERFEPAFDPAEEVDPSLFRPHGNGLRGVVADAPPQEVVSETPRDRGSGVRGVG